METYLDTWRSTGAMQKLQAKHVETTTHEHLEDIILPWPTISKDPTPYFDDARFVKAFPLEFPMGVGDLRQPRLRSDFTSIEWLQHFSLLLRSFLVFESRSSFCVGCI